MADMNGAIVRSPAAADIMAVVAAMPGVAVVTLAVAVVTPAVAVAMPVVTVAVALPLPVVTLVPLAVMAEEAVTAVVAATKAIAN
jgi:hypothetical protein